MDSKLFTDAFRFPFSVYDAKIIRPDFSDYVWAYHFHPVFFVLYLKYAQHRRQNVTDESIRETIDDYMENFAEIMETLTEDQLAQTRAKITTLIDAAPQEIARIQKEVTFGNVTSGIAYFAFSMFGLQPSAMESVNMQICFKTYFKQNDTFGSECGGDCSGDCSSGDCGGDCDC